MKKFILLLFFIPLLSIADDFTIDETKSDIYFANGIDTSKKDAQKNFNFRSDFLGKNYE